jgi:type VI secretion system secreted protein VgrG
VAEMEVKIEATLDVEGTPFRVLRYDLIESVSALSLCECEVMEDDAEPRSPGDLIGKTAKLELGRADGSQTRTFTGRVVVAERIADEDGVRTVHLEIAPVPWQLGKRADCRVFRDLSVPDIMKKVLEKGGVAADKQDWRLTGDHPVREYTVQYRESDFDFLQRLLSEEGIYFAVHVVDGVDKIILGDDPKGLGDVEGTSTLPFRHGSGAHEIGDLVYRASQVLSAHSDKVMLRDYNPEKPKLKVEGEASGEGTGQLEVYDYPGRFADPGDGKRLSEILRDELQIERDVVELEVGSMALLPGLRFTLEEHPYAPLNREYIALRARLVGSFPRLGAGEGAREPATQRFQIVAIPSTTLLRPPRRPRTTLMPGLQTAFVTGASGQEINVHGSGQVKIWHHWDRLQPKDDTASNWIRTSQLPTGGSMLLPRVGWEVTVSCGEGDPDRPYVMGRLYNGTAPPPYALPGEATKSSLQTATSPGGGSTNEFRTCDKKGSEEMFFNASKDMAMDVKNNTTESVGANSTRSIGSNQKKNVTDSSTATVAGSQTVSVGGDQALHVETKMQDEVGGDHTLDIGGNRDMKVGGDHKRDVGGSGTLDVGGRQIDLVVGSTTESVLGSYTHDVSTALVDITVANRSLMVGGMIDEKAGAVKIIAVKGGRGVEVGGAMMQQVAGAIINIATGSRIESAGATYTEIAAGAHIVKADNIFIEGESMIALVMGASTLTLMPALVALAGVSVKLDGDLVDTGAMVIDN